MNGLIGMLEDYAYGCETGDNRLPFDVIVQVLAYVMCPLNIRHSPRWHECGTAQAQARHFF